MPSSVIEKLFVSLLIANFCYSNAYASKLDSVEYKLKALYIISLAGFINWPENSQKQSFKICIDSSDQVAVQLKKQTLTEIKGRKLEILDPPTDASISQCDFLYSSEGNIHSSLAHLPVFTLSSQQGFAEQGGMIEFYIDQAKVRMKANLQAVNKADIRLSSKLLRLIKIVKQLELGESDD